MVYNTVANQLMISDAYLSNRKTGTYKTKFAEMYGYNSSGVQVTDSQKTNFVSTSPDAQFYLGAFGFTGSYTATDVKHVVIRVVGTLLNGTNETLLAYRDVIPIDGSIMDPLVKCFTPGSLILSPEGYKPVELFKNGDIVTTADKRSVSVKVYSFNVQSTPLTAPFLIPANTFSKGNPKNDLRLSPWHGFQIKRGYWLKPFVASLMYKSIIQYDLEKEITYYHLECPNYFTDNLVCNGTVVESYSGDQLNGMKTGTYNWNSTNKAYTRSLSNKCVK